ncbi:MAG TPA: hypothetical protein VMW41_04070 [Candidatus Bathyarchaeia archaeon]|nr:hypothetical protein [Candidatus Bathyarchaeia archaeon]
MSEEQRQPIPLKLGTFPNPEVFRNPILALEAAVEIKLYTGLTDLLSQLSQNIELKGTWANVCSGMGIYVVHAALLHGIERVVHIDRQPELKHLFSQRMHFLLFSNEEIWGENALPYEDRDNKVRQAVDRDFRVADIIELSQLAENSSVPTENFNGGFLLNPSGGKAIAASAVFLNYHLKRGSPVVLVEDKNEFPGTLGIFENHGFSKTDFVNADTISGPRSLVLVKN